MCYYESFDRMFGDIFNTFWTDINKKGHIKESDDQCVIEIDLPGYEKSDIKIKIINKILEIEADNKERGKYENKYTIPDKIDIAKVSSKYVNGVLSIYLKYKVDYTSSKDIKIE